MAKSKRYPDGGGESTLKKKKGATGNEEKEEEEKVRIMYSGVVLHPHARRRVSGVCLRCAQLARAHLIPKQYSHSSPREATTPEKLVGVLLLLRILSAVCGISSSLLLVLLQAALFHLLCVGVHSRVIVGIGKHTESAEACVRLYRTNFSADARSLSFLLLPAPTVFFFSFLSLLFWVERSAI